MTENLSWYPANDVYALRCAYLHQGNDDISDQRARELLTAFQFVIPPNPTIEIHMHVSGGVLQLQVDTFCRDMHRAVGNWYNALPRSAEINERELQTLRIVDMRQRS